MKIVNSGIILIALITIQTNTLISPSPPNTRNKATHGKLLFFMPQIQQRNQILARQGEAIFQEQAQKNNAFILNEANIDDKFNPNEDLFSPTSTKNKDQDNQIPQWQVHSSQIQTNPMKSENQQVKTVDSKNKKEGGSLISSVFNLMLDLVGKKISSTFSSKSNSESTNNIENSLTVNSENGQQKQQIKIDKEHERVEVIKNHQVKQVQQQQPKRSHKKERRRYFVIATLMFGLFALVAIKIYKKKEDQSEDYNRCGVSVPIEQIQI